MRIPTVFGRLVYVSSLRDRSQDRYSHATLERTWGDEETDRTLRQSHQDLFCEWIGCGLEDQKSDLEGYLKNPANSGDLRTLYGELVPQSAQEIERQLYLADFEALLEVLSLEPRAGLSARAASPPR